MEDFPDYPLVENGAPSHPAADGRELLGFWSGGRTFAIGVTTYCKRHHLTGTVTSGQLSFRKTSVLVQIIATPEELRRFIRWSDKWFPRHKIGHSFDLYVNDGVS